MGSRRKGRSLNGLLLLDKPIGVSSNNILQKVRWLFNAKKAGHTGSLDPLATGMLPICFGEGTKFSQFLLNSEKAYKVTAQLGVATTTGDSEGEVRETKPVSVTKDELLKIVMSFLGDTMQVPSMFSALKQNGVPLYKLARQGIEVERPARPITIFDLTLESFDGVYFSLYVHCSKGTYIRSLIEDIGEQLNCGAHVTQLHREWVGSFKDQRMVTVEELEILKENDNLSKMDEFLFSVDSIINELPIINLTPEMSAYFCNGQAVTFSVLDIDVNYRVYDQEKLLGIGVMNDDGQLAPKRLIAQ